MTIYYKLLKAKEIVGIGITDETVIPFSFNSLLTIKKIKKEEYEQLDKEFYFTDKKVQKLM